MKETARINRQVLFNYKTYGRRHLYGGAIEQLNKNTITLPAYQRIDSVVHPQESLNVSKDTVNKCRNITKTVFTFTI